MQIFHRSEFNASVTFADASICEFRFQIGMWQRYGPFLGLDADQEVTLD
jgi:hypothetical protein